MARVLEYYGFEILHTCEHGISYRFGSFGGVCVKEHGEMLREHGYEMEKFEGNNSIVIEPV